MGYWGAYLTQQSIFWLSGCPSISQHRRYVLKNYSSWHTLPPTLSLCSPWASLLLCLLFVYRTQAFWLHGLLVSLSPGLPPLLAAGPLSCPYSVFSSSLALPTPSPQLMTQFSLDPSRCLWLFSPSSLQYTFSAALPRSSHVLVFIEWHKLTNSRG